MHPNRSAGNAYCLERKYVTEQSIFDLETERVFERSWVCVCRESELQSDRGAWRFELGANKLFLIKDASDNIRAFRNFCRHRGSLLVTDGNCQKIGKRIQCPYHAWTYERDGKLAAAPNMDGVESFCSDDFGLIDIPCETHGGFVWASISPEKSLEQFLQPLESHFADWSISELQVAQEITYQVNANWKLIFQNYNECYHCPTVHPALNRLTPYKDSSNMVESGPILGGPMQLSDDGETMSMDGKRVGQQLPKLSAQQARSIHYFTIFPTIFLSTHPDYVLVHRIERISIGETRVTCQFLFHPNSLAQDNFAPGPAIEFWDMTNRQDWEVCELAQSGMEEKGYRPGLYSNLESVLAAFDQYYFHELQRE